MQVELTSAAAEFRDLVFDALRADPVLNTIMLSAVAAHRGAGQRRDDRGLRRTLARADRHGGRRGQARPAARARRPEHAGRRRRRWVASMDDVPLAREWYGTAAGILGEPMTDDQAEQVVVRQIGEGTLWFWYDGDRPVSLVGYRRPQYGVSRVGPVAIGYQPVADFVQYRFRSLR